MTTWEHAVTLMKDQSYVFDQNNYIYRARLDVDVPNVHGVIGYGFSTSIDLLAQNKSGQRWGVVQTNGSITTRIGPVVIERRKRFSPWEFVGYIDQNQTYTFDQSKYAYMAKDNGGTSIYASIGTSYGLSDLDLIGISNDPSTSYCGLIQFNGTMTVPQFHQIKLYRSKLNTTPTITLLNPTNNQTLTEGISYKIEGSADDPDVGNVVTAKYKINNGRIRALQSGVSNGSTPISFVLNLTYRDKRLWDREADVYGSDLAENVDHTLTVWAEDDQGGRSAEVTRTFRVVWNRPPVIDGENRDLGIMEVPPSVNYTVTEPESNSFMVTEKINGVVFRTFPGVAGRQETVTIPQETWLRLEPGVLHTMSIEATDDKGMSSTRVFTLTRFEDEISFEIEAPWTTDAAAKRVLLTLDMNIPAGAILIAEASNNAFDAAPTWEDISFHARYGRGYVFLNTKKTAAKWGVCLRVHIEKGTASEPIEIKGFGGAFD